MEVLQATSYSIYAHKKTVSGMRATKPRTAIMYSAAVYNSDDSILEVRQSWDIGKLFSWLESFGFDVSIERNIL